MAEAPNIAVIGAGLMGHGIAYALASAGSRVSVFDLSEKVLESLPARLGRIAELLGDPPGIAASVRACASLAAAAASARLAIEAVAENLEIKRSIIAELEAAMETDAIIGSNTSALPISRIARNASYPERIVGMHFWNPPHLVKLVEVVQAERSGVEAVHGAISLLSNAGYRAVHVKKDLPGFIGNRLQHALKREAIALVSDGVCDAATVDDVVKLGFGRRLGVVGPLEQSDMVGLDLTRAIHETLMPDIDRTDRPSPLLEKLVSEGKLGMSTGEGFYKWTPAAAEAVRNRLRDFLAAQAKSQQS